MAVVQVLLAADADIEARKDGGQTPLHFAAQLEESGAVIEALLAAGADAKAQDDDGETPLHRAKSKAAVQAWSRLGPIPTPNSLANRGACCPLTDGKPGAPRAYGTERMHRWPFRLGGLGRCLGQGSDMRS